MITFRHCSTRQTTTIATGEAWCYSHAGATYRDTDPSEIAALLLAIDSGVPWREAAGTRFAIRFPWLHQIVTSPKRDLFFREHPPFPGARILDIGSGWGQMALPLARFEHVTALEPTPERLAFIRAAAKQDGVADNIHFVQADFLDLEFDTKYDLACCVGVL